MEHHLKPAAGPGFYDRALADRRNSQWLPLRANPYRMLWAATAELVPGRATIVELGCGTGRLAPLLAARGRSYLGLDFAPAVIAEARRYFPEGRFEVADLTRDPIPEADVYVADEVLEHLDDDLGLLAALPCGSLVVLSVPSFDSAAHVRFFPVWGDAADRYRVLLELDRALRIPHGKAGRFFHLLRGRVR